MTHLPKHVDDALGRHWTEASDQRLGVEPLEEFHHVIKCAIIGDTEVEQRDRMRGSESSDYLGFPLKPSPRVVGDPGFGMPESA